MDKDQYYRIIEHYEKCLFKFGPNYRGMDWPNQKDLNVRFQVMWELIKTCNDKKVTILDIGCGVGLFLDFLKQKNIVKTIEYIGLDISRHMIEHARKRHPGFLFIQKDILKDNTELKANYVIMNGLLTEKIDLSFDEMRKYAKRLIKKAFSIARDGIAFNVMSPFVDWFRNDLFYWSLDDICSFIVKECTRNFIIRHDYGLYEYTLYLYK
ncbi:class I SAM-dependent methyltransferase [Desulfothermus okinawensis JCM 13304]